MKVMRAAEVTNANGKVWEITLPDTFESGENLIAIDNPTHVWWEKRQGRVVFSFKSESQAMKFTENLYFNLKKKKNKKK